MGKRGFISANNALFVSVDLIGEKNQVILELVIKHINAVSENIFTLLILKTQSFLYFCLVLFCVV